jgi:hypothetical protein
VIFTGLIEQKSVISARCNLPFYFTALCSNSVIGTLFDALALESARKKEKTGWFLLCCKFTMSWCYSLPSGLLLQAAGLGRFLPPRLLGFRCSSQLKVCCIYVNSSILDEGALVKMSPVEIEDHFIRVCDIQFVTFQSRFLWSSFVIYLS